MKLKDMIIIVLLLLIMLVLYYKLHRQRKEFLEISSNKLIDTTKKLFNFNFNNIINQECYDLSNNKCITVNNINKIIIKIRMYYPIMNFIKN